jgi:hypothetical protein
MSSLPQALQDFFAEQKARYGEFFWYQEEEDKDSKSVIIVMLEKIASQARDLSSEANLSIVSFEKDRSLGFWARVNQDGVQLYNTASKQEWESIRDEIINTPTINWHNDLIKGELIRVYEVKGFPEWYAATVYHDFEGLAPRAIGWVRRGEDLKRLAGPEYYRLNNLLSLEVVCQKYENLSYQTGAKTKDHGFDCSGLVQRIVLETRNIWLPRKTQWQALVCQEISLNNLQPGDLVFFKKRNENKIDHVSLVFEIQSGKLPVIFHTKKIIGKAIFQDLNKAEWLNQWEVAKYGRVGKQG